MGTPVNNAGEDPYQSSQTDLGKKSRLIDQELPEDLPDQLVVLSGCRGS
jgi:hypothetical protein